MNFISSSFASPVTAATVKSPRDKDGAPLIADEEQVKTFKSFFETYNSLSDHCFRHCVWDFGVDSMRNREVRCVMRCAEHYLQTTKEIGKGFTESQEPKAASVATQE